MRNANDGTPPSWNLVDLYDGPDDPRLDKDLARVAELSEAFASRYRGNLATLTPAELAIAIADFERIHQSSVLPNHFVSLRFAAESSPENGARMQSIQEKTTAATVSLLFFHVELTTFGADRLRTLADAGELVTYRHYLQGLAAWATHTLSEAEERLQEELSNTGSRAFRRLFQEIVTGIRCVVPGHAETLSLSETLNLQYDADRAVRKASAEAVTDALKTHERTLAFLFNTLLQDKATQDRLRGHAYPEEARHIGNELRPETVETVVNVVTGGYGHVARFFEIKRRLLGLPTLTHYDRYAPLNLAADPPPTPYDDARDLILRAFARFDETDYAATARRFFDGNWIDAEVRPDKRGGAFCDYVTPDHHPYLFVNYLGKPSDIRTLAHELGHGIHSYLSRDQTYFNYHGTLGMAEAASTFAERLLSEEQNFTVSDAERLEGLGREIQASIATIFRQTAMYQFERAIHAERRAHGELTPARFGEIWQESVGAMFAGSVTLEPGHAVWWSYVSHFVASPFYVYAYSFGEMLALALYHRYREEGRSFVPKYLALLKAGGSLSPVELAAPLGIDLNDPAFWQGALEVFAAEVGEFETLARKFAPEKFAD